MRFAKQLLGQSPNASVSLMEFGQAAITMVKFTSDPAEFDKGVNRIVSRPGVGSVLGEALEAANKDLAERAESPPGYRLASTSSPATNRASRTPTRSGEAFRQVGSASSGRCRCSAAG